jgi:hypothetical protein
VISVITHLGEVLSDEFLESTGFGQFVRSNAIEFRRLFDRQRFSSVSFAPLRLIIPESLDSTPLRIASLGRIVQSRLQSARERMSYGFALSSLRTFTDSIQWLNGNPSEVLSRFPENRLTDASYGTSWFDQLVSQIFSSPLTDPNGALFRLRGGSGWLEIDTSRPFSSESAQFYKAVGRLLAISIAFGQPLGVHLPARFFAGSWFSHSSCRM